MAGAKLKLEIDKSGFKKFMQLRHMFPDLMARTLGYIGSQGEKKLKKEFLSGQEIDLRAYPLDKKGKETISYSIGKGAKYLKIRSYPVNLFEKGRMLRSGKKEPGKYILTKKFKTAMMSSVHAMAREFDRKILQGEMDKI